MIKTISFLSVVLAMLYIPNSIADDKTKKSPEEMMSDYMLLAQPGTQHQLLENMTGKWNQEIKLWTQPDQAEPAIFKGTSNNKLILGGRFLQIESKGGVGDWYTESLTFLGFDRRHQKYTTVSMDTWGTYYVTAKGEYSEATKTITMYGEDYDPVMDITQRYNMIYRFPNPNQYISEVVFKDFRSKGKDFKMVEIVHTKSK